MKRKHLLVLTAVVLLGLAVVWHCMGRPTISACWFFNEHHIYCPGCGCTRALIALVGGNILRSLYYNPAVTFTGVLIPVYLLSQTIWRLRGRRGWVLHYSAWWFPALFVILTVNCLLRNVLWWCFAIPLSGYSCFSLTAWIS